MSKAIVAKTEKSNCAWEVIEKVMITGDLAPLSAEQRVEYYNAVCKAVGLNPLTKPFQYITLNGKLVLYADKGCAEQLRANKDVSIAIKETKQVGDVYIVIAEASMPDGRKDSSTGAVSLKGLGGDALANAVMKCETKAKRRVTLSICGLNMLDETETETIQNAPKGEPVQPPPTRAIAEQRAEQTPVVPTVPPKVLPKEPTGPTRASVWAEAVKLGKQINWSEQDVENFLVEKAAPAALKSLSPAKVKEFVDQMAAEYFGPGANG